MNFNFILQCDSCETLTNVRLGMSNRAEQPLAFACEECGQQIEILLNIGKGLSFEGALQFHEKDKVFADSGKFIDLHLDFPVYKGPYVMGMTPFMRASGKMEIEDLMTFNAKLNYLNERPTAGKILSTFIKHYERGKITPFKSVGGKFFDEHIATNDARDVDTMLYRGLEKALRPFAAPEKESEAIRIVKGVFVDSKKNFSDEMMAFVAALSDGNFLDSTHKKALEVYPRILKIELVLRPALFLDAIGSNGDDEQVPIRISTSNFSNIRDLYKDIIETISSQMTVLAGFNNVVKRRDHDAFAAGVYMTRDGRDRKPDNLNIYAKLDSGRKREFVDDSTFPLDVDAIDGQLRNAIAHHKTEYDEISQIVSYFPQVKGLDGGRKEEITFAAFTVSLLIAYREMRRMHLLIIYLLVLRRTPFS